MQTPFDYYSRYHCITVSSPGAAEALASGIRVDRYRLGAQQPYIDERARLARKVKTDLEIRRRTDPTAGISVLVETPDGWEEYGFPDFRTTENDQLWALLRYPYVGKGSPESIQVALQLAAVDLPESPPMVLPEDFQSYCDRWFGVDCNGFVGNYLRHVYGGVSWSDVNLSSDASEANDLISTIWDKFEGVERAQLDEVDASELNLLVMTDGNGEVVPGGKPPYGHIMISVPGESAKVVNSLQKLPGKADAEMPAIAVVEATAAKDSTDGLSGLARSFYAYAYVGTQPGMFTVLRGLNNTAMHVRVKGAPWAQ